MSELLKVYGLRCCIAGIVIWIAIAGAAWVICAIGSRTDAHLRMGEDRE